MKTPVLPLILLSMGMALVATAHAAAQERPEYTVNIEPGITPTARIKLSIPGSLEAPTLFSQARKLGILSQVQDVKCGVHVVAEVDNRWVLPAGCRYVTWTVNLVQTAKEEVSGSDQLSMLMPGGWYVFSAPSSLLRLTKEPKDGSEITFFGSRLQRQTKELKHSSFAPSYFVLGMPPTQEFTDGIFRLRYVGDNLAAVLGLVDPALHLKAIRYYREKMGPKIARDVSELTVVWMPVASRKRSYGGATGTDMFFANYPARPDRENEFKPFVIILHEQFHHIDGGTIGGGYRPTWVGESLAQYYALKAMLNLSGNAPKYKRVWDRWYFDAAKTEGKILEAQRRVGVRDFSQYGLFYTRGTMFWRDIDAALKRAGEPEGLDAHLSVILGSPFDPDHRIPASVLDELNAIPEAELRALIEHYL